MHKHKYQNVQNGMVFDIFTNEWMTVEDWEFENDQLK